MFAKPEVMTMAFAMSAHAAERQAVIAGNIANADTPGYRARDLEPFASVYAGSAPDLRATRPGHLTAVGGPAAAETVERPGGHLAPNGNGVSLEGEMVAAADVRRDHDTALAVYRSALDILRASLGRR